MSQLTELLFALNFSQSFHLVGMSMGGGNRETLGYLTRFRVAVAVKYASLYPSKIRSLSLLAPAGLPFKLPPVSYLVHVPILADIIYPFLGPRMFLARAGGGFPGNKHNIVLAFFYSFSLSFAFSFCI